MLVPQGLLKYNTAYICAHELGAFLHKYDKEMVDGLSAFYDLIPYQQERRGEAIRIKIERPQINMITGSTPQNLMDLMPEKAWGQGFSSRIIMVFSDERIIGDDFAQRDPGKFESLSHDIRHINQLHGKFHVTQEYVDCINNWRQQGEVPVPDHPKLIHYVTRRRVHLYKLSMVSSVDRGDSLALTREDFNRAMNWLVEAETYMSEIFKAGATNADGQAMDEILHFITLFDRGQGVPETRIVAEARKYIPAHSVLRVIEILEASGQIKAVRHDKRIHVTYYSVLRNPASEMPVHSILDEEPSQLN